MFVCVCVCVCVVRAANRIVANRMEEAVTVLRLNMIFHSVNNVCDETLTLLHTAGPASISDVIISSGNIVTLDPVRQLVISFLPSG